MFLNGWKFRLAALAAQVELFRCGGGVMIRVRHLNFAEVLKYQWVIGGLDGDRLMASSSAASIALDRSA